MTEAKLTNCLLAALIIFIATMFIWTMNTLKDTEQITIPTTISGFSA